MIRLCAQTTGTPNCYVLVAYGLFSVLIKTFINKPGCEPQITYSSLYGMIVNLINVLVGEYPFLLFVMPDKGSLYSIFILFAFHSCRGISLPRGLMLSSSERLK